MGAKELRFEFGKNWAAFLRVLTDERIAAAEDSLKASLRVDRLDGKTFLDIGCGSGLFSLAAMRLGATVHSFDYDPLSVACTEELKKRYFPSNSDWTIECASALDSNYLSTLGEFDIVYSWGVLHHTGNMWQALTNVTTLVKPGGVLLVAIYNELGTQTERWRAIKRLYVSSSSGFRFLIVGTLWTALQFRASAARLARFRNPLPFREWREYKKKRGMSPWHDFVDWVGGYPYETARPEEIFEFYRKQGFRLESLKTGGLGCNEFMFLRDEPQRLSAQTARASSGGVERRSDHGFESYFNIAIARYNAAGAVNAHAPHEHEIERREAV